MNYALKFYQVKQFAVCVEDWFMKNKNARVEMYLDVWTSLNGRFSQRMYDPNVDMVKAQWSPFEKPSWVLPIITEFTEARKELRQLEEDKLRFKNTFVLFAADFPGNLNVLTNEQTFEIFFNQLLNVYSKQTINYFNCRL